MNKEQRLAAYILKNKAKFYCLAVRPATIQRINLFSVSWYRYFGAQVINFRGRGDDICYYFERSKYEKPSLALKKRLDSPVLAKKHLQQYRIVTSRLLAIGRSVLKLPEDRAELLKFFIEYRKALIDFAPYFITTFSVDDFVFPAFAADLKKNISSNEYDSALKAISSPTIVFGYQKYQQALVKAVTAADFKRLAKEFLWIKEYSFQEKLLDVRMAREDKRRLIKEGLAKDILGTAASCRRNQEELKIILRGVRDPRLRMRARVINDYINIKTERIETYKIFQTDFRNFFEKLLVLVRTAQSAASYEEMISLTDPEIIAFLKTGRKIDLVSARRRFAKRYVSLSQKGRTEFIYDNKLVKKIRNTFLAVKSIKEIKGNIVSRGQARGRVGLVLNNSDLVKFQAGQVLVSNFTTPEYVPAMKKAIAIITDDGGITCHAAIIARELGKPCVVGTKEATRLLKNGDLVEVNASTGLVRIIKKAKN